MIAPSASVNPEATLGSGVQIGHGAIIEGGARLGDGCVIGEYAIVRRGTVLGARCRIDAHAVIGGLPQDLRFDPATPSGVEIGDDVTIREGVTIHRSTQAGSVTRIGHHCFLMAQCHVAHDCVIGNHSILANAVLLAGHVQIGDHAFLGGSAVVHQFVRIGDGAMIGGGSRLSRDVPPQCMVAERDGLVGLNIVGLRRRGCTGARLTALKQAFHAVYDGAGNPRPAAHAWLANVTAADAPEAYGFLLFFGSGKRQFVRPRRGALDAPTD
jgi:UDP-N-acetylglucosamine acyltransferase